ncbi:hypothetical protein [Psychrobacter sp. ASPA161_9]|uniref:hypothetical protein n=1 Tax=Psychrobacter sp. ASPA161_9 TaxID=3160961 RepID=UPI003F80DD1A
MNIKLAIFLVTLPAVLYGCATTNMIPYSNESGMGSSSSAPVISKDSAINSDPLISRRPASVTKYRQKSRSDGSHLLNLPMSRDFIMDSNNNFQGIDVKGSKKIFSIKPTGDTQPRAVILLEDRIRPSSGWTISDLSLNDIKDSNPYVRRKNIDICKGFMTLTTVEELERQGKNTGNVLEADRKNHVVTYMPAVGRNKNNLPKTSADCKTFVGNNYDYDSSIEELTFILGDNRIGKSPYLALYESPTSPYASMFLSLGELSPKALRTLASNWNELIEKVYKHGKKIDPTVGIAVMLAEDPALYKIHNEAILDHMNILVPSTMCAGEIIGGTLVTSATGPAVIFIGLGVFLNSPGCQKLVADARHTFGYEK